MVDTTSLSTLPSVIKEGIDNRLKDLHTASSASTFLSPPCRLPLKTQSARTEVIKYANSLQGISRRYNHS